MQRFQRFIGRPVDVNRIREPGTLSSSGISVRYLPEELDEFDEMEFGAGSWEGRDLVFTLVLEHGVVARISLGYIPPGGSEDDMMAFSESQLQAVLALKGKDLESFFDSVLTK